MTHRRLDGTPCSREAAKAGEIVLAITEAIREAGSIPSGHLYAVLCGELSAADFDAAIDVAVRAKLVERRGDLLRWIGPDLDNPRKHAGQGLTGWR
jgi:hypothetical protein